MKPTQKLSGNPVKPFKKVNRVKISNFSYNVYLKAIYGAVSGDFEPFNNAWNMIEQFMIPELQENTDRYDPSNPGTSAGITVGQDPIFNEIKEAYNTSDIYIMHWLSDVDNIYGFGRFQVVFSRLFCSERTFRQYSGSVRTRT